jgi:Rad3-related DNA helicase
MSLLTHFQGQPRPIQVEILKQVESHISSGYRFIVIQAPTGSGKSFINAAVARSNETSAILTSTTDLQDQYKRDFQWMYTIRGKSNFPCKQLENKLGQLTLLSKVRKKDLTCDKGDCYNPNQKTWCKYHPDVDDFSVEGKATLHEKISFRLDEDDYCDYYIQKYKGLAASHTIFNYAEYLSLLLFTHDLQNRNVLICDEAHDLENHVVNFFGTTIWRGWAEFVEAPFPEFSRESEYDVRKWLEYLNALADRYTEFTHTCSRAVKAGEEDETFNLDNLKKGEKRLENILFIISEVMNDYNNYVVAKVNRDPNDRIRWATIQPIDVSKQAARMFENTKLNIFTSATVDKDVFCRSAGIDKNECAFVQVRQSSFPVKNRTVNFLNTVSLNARNIGAEMNTIISKIDEIMTTHYDQKGLILTTSYKQVAQIEERLTTQNKSRLIKTGDEEITRTDLMKTHTDSERPTVLISPSLWQGIDLHDDLCRFLIIVKAPYLDLGDRRIAAKRDRDKQWYLVQSAMRLLQGAGRAVRHDADFCKIYVLDKNASILVDRMKPVLPSWFLDACNMEVDGRN